MKATMGFLLLLVSTIAWAEEVICTPTYVASTDMNQSVPNVLSQVDEEKGRFRLVLGDAPQFGSIQRDNMNGWNWHETTSMEVSEGYLLFTQDTINNTITTHALSEDLTRLITSHSKTGALRSDMAGLLYVSYCIPL